jgi:hypothetical protein
MFKIADGREYFYQWDLDRQVIVEDNSITEVHFCNRTDECSLVVEVVDGLANVPNIILQQSFDVRVFGYDGKATRFDKVFKVKPRTRPADYVYTETEIKNFETLQKQIDEILNKIEEGGGGGVADAAFEALEVRVTNLDKPGGRVDKLEGQISAIDGALYNYGSGEFIYNFPTHEELADAIENIEIPEVDLSGYYTKAEIDTLLADLPAGQEYRNFEEVGF